MIDFRKILTNKDVHTYLIRQTLTYRHLFDGGSIISWNAEMQIRQEHSHVSRVPILLMLHQNSSIVLQKFEILQKKNPAATSTAEEAEDPLLVLMN